MLTRGFGDMIRPRFVPPPTIREMFFPNTYVRFNGIRMMVLPFGTLHLSASSEAATLGMTWESFTKDSATQDALTQAVRGAAIATEVQDLAATVGWDALRDVSLKFLAGPDTGVHAPLVRMRVPMIPIESNATSTNGSVRYPNDVSGNLSASVQLEFIVDETAHVLPGSIVVIQTSDPRFIAAAVNGVKSQTFTAARSGGCPVKTRVDQFVKFSRGKS
jgi:hypothetical protein